MYTYHHIFVGFIISEQERGLTLLPALRDMCQEWDFSDSSDFTKDACNEYFDEFSLNLTDEEKSLLLDFAGWVYTNAEHLRYRSGYHGSGDTPISIEYRPTTPIKQNDCMSYVMPPKQLIQMLVDVENFYKFCERTMPKQLFKYLKDLNQFGLQFLSCSS